MPCARNGPEPYGRALGREHLDALILAGAAQAGAAVLQPCTLTRVEQVAGGFVCAAVAKDTRETTQLRARIIIAAHGSWERGTLPTQNLRCPPRASDLFAFKAHFRNSDLPAGLMPLLVFPGGYGGMVHSDGGRMSFSCCIRRDYLDRCRHQWRNAKASEAVFAHVRAACFGVDAALSGATRDGDWLSAGPIRPGIRPIRSDGILAVGNAAGEAHPIVAEGISMAMQSSWLLCERLIAQKDAAFSGHGIEAIGREYAASWRKNFSRRIHAAAVFAHLAMRPAAAQLVLTLLKRAPAILTLGAHLSGKTQLLSNFRNSDPQFR
jgi:flavin-dependent dehydrogenase